MKSIQSFFKDTAIYGLAAILPRLINFALLRVYTTVFNTTQFHDQTTYYVYAVFFNVILTMGMETSFLRYYAKEENKETVYATASMVLFFSSLVFAIIGTYFASPIGNLLGIHDSLAFKMLVWTTVLDTLVVIPFAYLRMTNQPLLYFALKMLNILILLAATILFLIVIPSRMKSVPSFWSQPQVLHMFLANLFASAVTFIVFIPRIIKTKWSWNPEILRKLWQYGWPIMVGGLAYGINENLDKLIIPVWIDEHTNGIYSACYKLSVFMTLYVTAFRLGAEPYFFSQSKHEDSKNKYSQIMSWFVILGGLFIVGVVAFIDILANIFISQDIYKTGLYIVPILLIANLLSGVYNNLSIWYKLTDQTIYGMYISIAGGVLTVITLLICVPLLGMVGGAWATLITYALMAAGSYFLGRKHFPVPYEIKKILFFLTFATLLSFVNFFFFKGNILVGILFILLYVGVAYYIQAVTHRWIKNT